MLSIHPAFAFPWLPSPPHYCQYPFLFLLFPKRFYILWLIIDCYGPISVIILSDKWKETEIVFMDAVDLIAEIGMVLDPYKEL